MRGKFIPKKLRHDRAGGRPGAEAEKVTVIRGGGFAWTDLQNPDRAHVEELARRHGLNALNVEDCLTKFELPKIDAYEDSMFITLHFPPLAARRPGARHSQLSIFMGRDFLVTVHQGELAPLVDLVGACTGDGDPERRERILGGSTGELLHEMVDVLVDDLLHTLRRITANLDDMEEEVFDDKRSAARKISVLRREITVLRRTVGPLKRIVPEAARRVGGFSGAEDLTLYFDDVMDHIDKVIDALEESRETMEIYKDTDFMLSTEKTNKVLSVLTVVFTLAIPATVIGTFYGMNVELPGGADGSGAYGTLAAILAASAVPAAVMLAYFKKAGWMSG